MKKNNFFLMLCLLGTVIFQNCNKQGSDESALGGLYADSSRSGAGLSSGSSGSGSSSGTGSGDTTKLKAGKLTAGEWNDLANIRMWDSLMGVEDWAKLRILWKMYPKNRQSVRLTDANGLFLQDAIVEAFDATTNQSLWASRTDNIGRAEIFTGFLSNSTPQSVQFKVTYQGQTTNLGIFNTTDSVIVRPINVSRVPLSNVDIMLVVDATGSMGDEINYLKVEFDDVINRVKQQMANRQLRIGSVFYRDKGDEYVTKAKDFTTDVSSIQSFVNQQSAGGGGDFPEAVDEAVKVALEQSWSTQAVTRILFLVLDAPPHDDAESVDKMRKMVEKASQKGVKIIPITASGIGKSTEFLMRFSAIATNGTYTFVTDHSGIGNPHLKPTVGTYKVEFLNDLMERLILKYAQ